MTRSNERSPLVVPDAGGTLGGADATRRYALDLPGVGCRFGGVTRPEGARAAEALAALSIGDPNDMLVEIALPVVMTDGAGPYLVDAAGALVLAVGAHPHLGGACIAMSGSGPASGCTVGLIEPVRLPLWGWQARCVVDHSARVACLDALDEVPSASAVGIWVDAWGHGA